jgi:hypothetical protein
MLQRQQMPRRAAWEHLAAVLHHPLFWAILGAWVAVLLLISMVREAH